eukprot:4683186-Prymnesium_polylepis.1
MDADDVLLTFLEASPQFPALCTARSESVSSLSSDLSNATTFIGDTAPLLVIRAFSIINGLMITLAFPSESNGWTYCHDIGSQSHHRWDYEDATIMLLSRQITCTKSSPRRPMCRNCKMEDTWRKHCCEPETSFYILNINNPSICVPALNAITLSFSTVTDSVAGRSQAWASA